MTRRIDVLAVDDDPETLEMIRLYLAETAFVTTAVGGKQALQCIRARRPDVILLDIEMPVMDGFQTLEMFRNTAECVNIPVIMLTGKSDKSSVTNAIALGVDGYLLKPVSKDELVDKVQKAYQKSHKPTKQRTVLAIDDDMVFLKQLHSLLGTHYNVIMINSAKMALEYLSGHTPDVILLDYQMPLYNGVTLIGLINQNRNCRNIPVIVLSGSLDQKAVQDFYPYSPAAFLAKPIEKERLIEKIEDALSKSSRGRGGWA